MTDQTLDDWDAYILGIDDAQARARTRESVRGSEAFAAHARATEEALARWSNSDAPGERDGHARVLVRERLYGTLFSVERFRPFFADLARSFALSIEATVALLRKVDQPSSYEAAPIPGVRFFHFTPGEGCGFVEAGIVKLSQGARFPRHRHLGKEINFVLEGALIEDGVSHGPGATVESAPGSEHDYLAGDKRDLILVAGHNGITYIEG